MSDVPVVGSVEGSASPAKHTPGPWKSLPSEPDDSGFIVQPIVSDTTKGMVAEVYGGTILPEPYANARLIAAAPDLLATLKTVIDSAVPHPVEHPTMFPAWALARQVIAKAEGAPAAHPEATEPSSQDQPTKRD